MRTTAAAHTVVYCTVVYYSSSIFIATIRTVVFKAVEGGTRKVVYVRSSGTRVPH